MTIVYASSKVESLCTSYKDAIKYFDGDKNLAFHLLSKINMLKAADSLHDIIVQPQHRFHKLLNKGTHKNYDGYYALDVQNKTKPWRIIIEPLNSDLSSKVKFRIDIDAISTKTILIKEVSNHYE